MENATLPLEEFFLSQDIVNIQIECDMGGQGRIARAGFSEITILSKPHPSYGIAFPGPWSFPLLARKPL